MSDSKIPYGHLISAHHLFDFCALCPGRTEREELNAWRMHSFKQEDMQEVIAREQGEPLPPHIWREFNQTSNTCHFPGCTLSEKEHPA